MWMTEHILADTEKGKQNSKWQFYSADRIGQPYHQSPGYCSGTLGCPADLKLLVGALGNRNRCFDIALPPILTGAAMGAVTEL